MRIFVALLLCFLLYAVFSACLFIKIDAPLPPAVTITMQPPFDPRGLPILFRPLECSNDYFSLRILPNGATYFFRDSHPCGQTLNEN